MTEYIQNVMDWVSVIISSDRSIIASSHWILTTYEEAALLLDSVKRTEALKYIAKLYVRYYVDHFVDVFLMLKKPRQKFSYFVLFCSYPVEVSIKFLYLIHAVQKSSN